MSGGKVQNELISSFFYYKKNERQVSTNPSYCLSEAAIKEVKPQPSGFLNHERSDLISGSWLALKVNAFYWSRRTSIPTREPFSIYLSIEPPPVETNENSFIRPIFSIRETVSPPPIITSPG
ncbi:MAG: hypothetical protein ACI88L_000209 [Candidatus Paceibacteria bacterium]|jgi:hypothetical protein